MQLFHFTNLLSLPAILREGITKGEVPISPNLAYNRRPSAANLTTNGSPTDQQVWIGGPTNKVAVRPTVDVPDAELTSFRAVKDRYAIRSSWLKVIAPYEHRRHWYFAFGGVRPDQIQRIEILENGEYRQLSQAEVQELVAMIEAEIAENLEIGLADSGMEAGARGFRFKSDWSDSWLIDGPELHSSIFGSGPAYPWRVGEAQLV